jgi:hypothetical protein
MTSAREKVGISTVMPSNSGVSVIWQLKRELQESGQTRISRIKTPEQRTPQNSPISAFNSMNEKKNTGSATIAKHHHPHEK